MELLASETQTKYGIGNAISVSGACSRSRRICSFLLACSNIFSLPVRILFPSVDQHEIVYLHLRNSVVVRASASQSVDLGFIHLVESYQKTLKNGINSFFAWRSAFKKGCEEKAGKFAGCVLGQGT